MEQMMNKTKNNEMAIEDIATVFASEFVKYAKEHLMPNQKDDWIKARNIPFLKMNYQKRKKIVESLLEKMVQFFKHKIKTKI